MKKLFLPLISLLTVLMFSGCGSFANMLKNGISDMLTTKTSDLSDAGVYIRFIRNCYPKVTDTDEIRMFKDDWIDGGNLITLQFYKMKGLGWLEVDGTVKIDGEVVPIRLMGTYGKKINDLSPKQIEITTTAGKTVKFTVSPIGDVQIAKVDKEINEQSDLNLELKGADEKNTKLRVGLLFSPSVTQNAFGEVLTLNANNKLKIPKEAFNHAETRSFREDNMLLVEKFTVTDVPSKDFADVKLISSSFDYTPVTVKGESEYIDYIKSNSDKNEFKYLFYKPNAITGKPFATAKKFAVITFSVRASKLKQSRDWTRYYTKQYETKEGGDRYLVTEHWKESGTTTKSFPKLPEKFWDNLLNTSYKKFTAAIQQQLPQIQFIPVEDVIKAPAYKELNEVVEEFSEVEYTKSYKGLKNFNAEDFSQIVSRMGPLQNKLCQQLGVDGVITATFDMEMPWDQYTLSPKFNFSIFGPGYDQRYALSTSYLSGIILGEGTPIENLMHEDGTVSEDVLMKVTKTDQIFKTVSDNLKNIKDQEEKFGYNKLWKLKI